MVRPKDATTGPAGATVGVRELRDGLSRYLERVKAGEAITITEHGRPIAKIIGTQYPPRLLELIAQGRATPPRSPRRTRPDEFPKVSVSGSVSDLVSEMRDK